MVDCPICGKGVKAKDINSHLDSGCETFIQDPSPPLTQNGNASKKPTSKPPVSNFFSTPAAKQIASELTPKTEAGSSPSVRRQVEPARAADPSKNIATPAPSRKRSFDDITAIKLEAEAVGAGEEKVVSAKRQKSNAFQKCAPLAERRRPSTLDEVVGQELVGEHGVLRSLIEHDRVPSMILWGGTSIHVDERRRIA